MSKKNKEVNLREKKNKMKKKILVFAAVVFFIFVLFGVIAIPKVKRAYTHLQEAQATLTTVQNDALAGTFDSTTEHTQQAQAELRQAKLELRILTPFRVVPLLGRQIGAVQNVLTAGDQLLDAAGDALSFAEELFNAIASSETVSMSSLTEEEKATLMKKILESPPVLQRVKSSIDSALLTVTDIPPTFLISPVQDVVVQLQEQLPKVQLALERYMPLAEVLPKIAGYPDEKTYLFLLQNNNELRPTGGFIGTYGLATIKNAEVKSFTTDNTYNLDDAISGTMINEKPWQLRVFGDPIRSEWFLRDGNWAADFPTASRDIISLYQLEGGTTQVDGVIAIDPTVIADILAMTGAITVSGSTFTQDNLVDALEHEVGFAFQYKGISLEDRKNVIGDLGNILLERLLSYPRIEWKNLLALLTTNLQEKHILLYSTDEAIQSVIKKQAWSGAIPATAYDYIYFVDANLAAKKTDQVMERKVSYSLEEKDDDYVATATMTYTHTGIQKNQVNKVTRYRTYTRLYVPEGSELIDVDGSMQGDYREPGDIETVQEFGKTSFGTFISIEPGESRTLTFSYKLPRSVVDTIRRNNQYELHVQKQPGTDAHDLVVSLAIDKKVTYINNYEYRTEDVGGESIAWKYDLREDRVFDAQLK